MRTIVLFLCVLMSTIQTYAQNRPLKVYGSVIESQSQSAVPFATVTAYNQEDGKLLTGTTTKEDGTFEMRIPIANVYFEVSFIGYENQRISDFNVSQGNINLGEIKLGQDVEMLQEVEIQAERSTVEFKLDKKVFNVGSDLSSSGLSAMEVLDNVPSVNVDVEGNINLRGNSGVQILIDGKPSVLADEGANALATLTSDMIESVEVITNPSAKYQAEGSSGIINIVLKKEEKKGLNGSVSLNTGWPHNHSVGGSINRRTEKFNLFTQFGVGYRSMPRYSENINENYITGDLIESEGVNYRNEAFGNITLGADYYINKYNTLTLSGRFAYEAEDQPAEVDFQLRNEDGELLQQYTRITEATAGNPKYQYDLQYEKRFKGKEDHTLQLNALGRFFGKSTNAEYTNVLVSGSTDLPEDQRTETEFFEASYTYKLDYTNPITEKLTLELGSMYEINNVGNDFAVYDWSDDEWLLDENLTNDFVFNQKVLGVYATGAYEGNRWGLKLGLRAEQTDLDTELKNTGEKNNRSYLNFFPSAHTSYKFTERFSMQAGYSRRIYRPRLWDLNPFFNISNSYSIRTGNPNLNPEYADSYELTSIFLFDQFSFNAGVYHLYTTEVIERVSTFENNVNTTIPMNIGTRNQTGFEFNGKYTPNKWFTLNADFNYGYFNRVGEFEGQDFSFDGSNWFTRATAKLKLPAEFDVEVSGNYQSSYKTVQGEMADFAHMDIGMRKRILNGKLILNAAVKDVFASRIRASTINQESFYLYSFSQRGRFITAGISFGFGKGDAMTYQGGRRR